MSRQTPNTNTTTNAYHLFNVQEVLVIIPSSKIRIVSSEHSLTKTGNCPSFLLGIDRFSQIPIIDIYKTFNIQWSVVPSYSMLVQATLWNDYRDITSSMDIGFFVDEYFGKINIHPDQIKLLNADPGNEQVGIVKIGKKQACILDLDNLFNKQKLKELYTYLVSMNRLN